MRGEQIRAKLNNARLPDWALLPDFGLYMDQVMTYVERCFAGLTDAAAVAITPAMMNNYVKSGLIDRPDGKKYTRASLAQLLMVCQLKQTTSMETMKRLLHPDGGADTEAMYGAFCKAQVRIADAFDEGKALDPLTCALEAASYQLICRLLLDGDEEEQA